MNLRSSLLAVLAASLLAAGFAAPRLSLSPSAPVPADLRLSERLEDAGWRLVEELTPGPARRLSAPASLIGGESLSVSPEWFVLVRAIHPPSARLPQESRSECGGTLYRGGLVVTAAHCLAEAWSRVEVLIEPRGREHGRAAWSLGLAALDAGFEPDGAGRHRHDRAVLRLPEDPGGGLDLPQSARAQVSPGETLTIFGMGLDEEGVLAQSVRICRQRATDVRLGVFEALGDLCRFRDADSGSLAARVLPGGEVVPVGIVSHRLQGAEDRQFYAPLSPAKIRAAWAALAESSPPEPLADLRPPT
ncbi:trypsin-like serine protease [Neomegalonema sp.]|uniref:trypsin-like serine protease n=1 Tax=Neomegalonema sp. TaxID=2039713 RepID=UPI0026047875|nr:trypsin-like serine protease [Neomegalonema sp.]MDD2869112.1 trypsin-like serine protease [Neomegalonema sp.]